jgi:hypothetical protein
MRKVSGRGYAVAVERRACCPVGQAGDENSGSRDGRSTWLDLLVYVAEFVVFFLVGLASDFYWGAMAAIASGIAWTVWKVKKP